MKTANIFLVAGLAWAGAAHAVPETLAELKQEQGQVVIHYERATARSAVFTPLLDARETMPVRVLLVGAEDSAAWRIGAAYVQGARKVLGNVSVVDNRAAVPADAYVVEISYTLGDHEVPSVSRTLEFKDGEKCEAQLDGSMKCGDALDTVVDKGKNVRMVKGSKAEVTIKLRTPTGDTVFEDVFSAAYAGGECGNPIAAASTIARVVGGQAVVRRPISQKFYSEIGVLDCQQK